MKRVFFFLAISLIGIHVFAQSEGYAQSDGVRIFYRVFGSGTPLLIINGGPGLNSDGFSGLAKLLSDHHQTIIYDQRGTGRSVLPTISSATITMQLMVDDIENLRKQLKIEKWIILGHSFGGMLASFYATQHPDHIIAMILSSSGGIDLELQSYAGNNINSRLTKAQLDTVNYWSGKISKGDTGYFARWHRASALANAYVYDKQYAPQIAARLVIANQQINSLMWQDMQKIKFNCAPKLVSFTKPVLIIQGKDDIVEKKTAEKAHAVLKNSKLVLLAHCVHYGWLDNKEGYLGEVESFIAAE